MDTTLAIMAPAGLLLLVVCGYLATVFEPYYAIRTAEGIELMEYHAGDLKLRLIAEWWAARLTGQPGDWYDGTNEATNRLCAALHYYLVRHRFLCGDDPRKITCSPRSLSPLLVKALRQAQVSPSPSSHELTLLITPNTVKSANGQVVWRGRPQQYRSRFCDMYEEP